jgi:hypothetical protein
MLLLCAFSLLLAQALAQCSTVGSTASGSSTLYNVNQKGPFSRLCIVWTTVGAQCATSVFFDGIAYNANRSCFTVAGVQCASLEGLTNLRSYFGQDLLMGFEITTSSGVVTIGETTSVYSDCGAVTELISINYGCCVAGMVFGGSGAGSGRACDGGCIAGAVIGSLAFVGIVVGAIVFYTSRRRSAQPQQLQLQTAQKNHDFEGLASAEPSGTENSSSVLRLED